MSVNGTTANNRIAQLMDSLLPLRRMIIILLHAGLVAGGYWLAFILRFELPVGREDWQWFLYTLPLILALRLLTFAWFHMYEEVWRYVSMRDILTILKAVSLSSAVFALLVLGLINPDFPWPIFPIDWGICLLFVGGGRLAIRALRESAVNGHPRGKRALVVGAGDAAEMLVREIERNPGLPYNVVGFVDDDPAKQGMRIHGKQVLGTIDGLPELCRTHDVHELLIAIPSATGEQMRRIIGACRSAQVDFKTIPNLRELTDSPSMAVKPRRLNIADLLRREPVRIDQVEVEKFISGKRVLVTGAGGSIGSELCRQVARFDPACLVMLDRSENGLFFVEMELREQFPQLAFHAVIADVTDEPRMAVVLEEHRPQVVFHAAAHKHVPLMEVNKVEAVKNNVRGTMLAARAAERCGVEDFVMISTDKAVRPSSVMGAAKRLAEIYVQALNAQSETRFITVRFGNVLASEGSVLQVFQRQIESGGPVTVTHPDMTRYFMTIPEASQLVLQAATQGKGGEIFVLDMGDPVRIVDLAKDLIALSGLDPERDIGIKFTGPRPGEKLFEELLNSETRVLPTSHEKILVVESDPVELGELESEIKTLLKLAEMDDEGGLLRRLTALVPGYVNEQGPASRRQKREERILIVESDSYTRTALKRMLQARYMILEAENQRDALKHAGESRPNLVILNFHLPRVNIGKLCARIRQEAELRAEPASSSGETSREPRREARAHEGTTVRMYEGTKVPGDGLNAEPGAESEAPSAGTEARAESSRVPIILLVDSRDTISSEQLRSLGADDRIYKPLPVSIVEKRVRDLLGRSAIR